MIIEEIDQNDGSSNLYFKTGILNNKSQVHLHTQKIHTNSINMYGIAEFELKGDPLLRIVLIDGYNRPLKLIKRFTQGV